MRQSNMLKLALNYTLFAIMATIVNFLTQEAVVTIYSGSLNLELAILTGTVSGLVTKYYLDKRYIFSHYSDTHAQDLQTFFIYSAMGVITTVIFWGFEYGFEYLFNDKTMRYIGGAIGLTIGYYVKYQLDKRFVFTTKAQP